MNSPTKRALKLNNNIPYSEYVISPSMNSPTKRALKQLMADIMVDIGWSINEQPNQKGTETYI